MHARDSKGRSEALLCCYTLTEATTTESQDSGGTQHTASIHTHGSWTEGKGTQLAWPLSQSYDANSKAGYDLLLLSIVLL